MTYLQPKLKLNAALPPSFHSSQIQHISSIQDINAYNCEHTILNHAFSFDRLPDILGRSAHLILELVLMNELDTIHKGYTRRFSFHINNDISNIPCFVMSPVQYACRLQHCMLK
jgi:hypothetical protein